jgi:hypothetical protein
VTLGQLVDTIKAAIYRQEGMDPDATNPGNLRDCPWFPGQPPLVSNGQVVSRRKYPDGTPVLYVITKSGVFWRPPTRVMGDCGAGHVIALHIAECNSLATLIENVWAPASDGNASAIYLANVMAWCNINSANAPLATLVDE